MNLRLGWRSLLAIAGFCVIVFCLVWIASVDRARWRATAVNGKSIALILLYKATGRITDMDWSDILWILRRGSGVNLWEFADHPNPFALIASPRRSAADIAAGELLFRNLCSSCHGERGTGAAGGPSLVDRAFRQGRTDWALYRTITLGVPGTAMVGRPLPRDDVWRLVSYLSHLMATQPEAITSRSNPALASFEPVTPDELRTTDDRPADWLTYSGSYAAHRYSRLRQINRDNVGQLRLEWARQFKTSTPSAAQTSPIVRVPVMFVTEPPNSVHALDATTGRVLWTYSRDLPSQLRLCCGPGNRGVALLGNRVFVGTLDAHLIALDVGTGRVLWDVSVAEYSSGYSITGAPLAIDGMVVTGVAGGEFAGTRGFIDAYDAASGQRRWRFYTVPAAGEPGSETWGGNSLSLGGAPTWVTGSFDPESRLLYWGVGNPSPDFYAENRPGDNLYSNSVVALDTDTGKLRWYFQFTPHDAHDWDATQVPVLLDGVVDGLPRKLLVTANRNGFYYVLDRITGEFLLGTPFVRQTWTDGLDAKGRPRVRPESIPTQQGSIVYPNNSGGTNWRSPSFDPESGLFYVPATDAGSIFFAFPKQRDVGGLDLMGWATPVPGEDVIVAVKAMEATTGRLRWQYTRPPRQSAHIMGGLTSTAGHIVFGGDLETLFALDADTGAELWHMEVGGEVMAAPVTYEVAGRQYVAVAAGRSILAFALPASTVQSGSPWAVH